jgi:hypothetical protein
VATKEVTPPEWEGEGVYREYFTILAFTEESVLEAARDAARKVTVVGKTTREESDQKVFNATLVERCLKGWHIMAPPDARVDPERMEQADGVCWWKFTPANVADLPWDLKAWLAAQIVSSAGSIPTRDLVTEGPTGKPLSFRWQDAGVGGGQ